MLVKGNSGFGIELVDELTIRKSAAGEQAKRLQRQIEKQILFGKSNHSEHVRTPKVFRTSDKDNAFYADMEFVVAEDFVQFLSEADRRALDDFCSVAVEFVSDNLASCRETEVSGEIRGKLGDLRQRGVPAIYTKAAENSCAGPVSVPVGSCHGDLTLSNILFKGRTLYLIDFLDCYVESPLQDVAKLRQDTQFLWSLELYQAEFNWPRIQIALRYLDGRIDAAFRAYDWYRRHYELFQFINLMRLLPYCVETKTSALVTRALDDMLGKFARKST
jgi:hypothetical protein